MNIRISGIYAIKNSSNGKIYIGSSKNIHSRWRGHLYLLRKNKHPNKHLQSSWNISQFEFIIVEEIKNFTELQLLERENYWIKFYKSDQNTFGYNMKPPSGLGIHVEAKWVCKNCKCIFYTPLYYKAKFCSRRCNVIYMHRHKIIDQSNRDKRECIICGVEFSVQHSKKTKCCSPKCGAISRRTRIQVKCGNCLKIFDSYPSQKRKYCSISCRAEDKTGIEMPEEQRIKIGLANSLSMIGNQNSLGTKRSPEVVEKMLLTWTGRKHTEESKRKMSEARKRYLEGIKS
jgi:hypothetical protein